MSFDVACDHMSFRDSANPFFFLTEAGFQGMQPQFNNSFFGGSGNQSNEWQNPHGAKRAREN